MSIWSSTYWLEGNRGNYGHPEEESWVVHLATARHYGDGGLVRVAVIERNDSPDETDAEAYLSPAEARVLADELIKAAETCEGAWAR